MTRNNRKIITFLLVLIGFSAQNVKIKAMLFFTFLFENHDFPGTSGFFISAKYKKS